MRPTRRSILATILTVPPAMLLRGGAAGAQDGALGLPLTPSCGDDPKPTVAQTAGPFYTPDSPLKRDLFADAPRGRPMTIAGFVVDARCKPLPGALVEIWHADEQGEYDNTGYRLRGHERTDDAGRWGFTTIETEPYTGRTAHYHFRVQAPGRRPLITQLYFPDNPGNRADRLFDSRLVLQMSQAAGRRVGRFNFVV